MGSPHACPAMLGSARKRVRVGSPDFIPGPIGMALMRRLIEGGRTIVVTTNSRGATDAPLACAGCERYRADMLRIGVVICEIDLAPVRRSPQPLGCAAFLTWPARQLASNFMGLMSPSVECNRWWL